MARRQAAQLREAPIPGPSSCQAYLPACSLVSKTAAATADRDASLLLLTPPPARPSPSLPRSLSPPAPRQKTSIRLAIPLPSTSTHVCTSWPAASFRRAVRGGDCRMTGGHRAVPCAYSAGYPAGGAVTVVAAVVCLCCHLFRLLLLLLRYVTLNIGVLLAAHSMALYILSTI